MRGHIYNRIPHTNAGRRSMYTDPNRVQNYTQQSARRNRGINHGGMGGWLDDLLNPGGTGEPAATFELEFSTNTLFKIGMAVVAATVIGNQINKAINKR